MNFDLSEEQRLLADSVKRYLERDYTFEKRKKIVASDEGYSEDVWKVFTDLGLLALPIPTEFGGFGGSAVDLAPVMELLGEALVVEPYLSTIMCARMLARTVSPDSASAATVGGPISSLLSAVAEGSMKLAFAQTEDGARYDLHHVAMKASRDGDGFVLDGTKRVVLHAPMAGRWLVSARTSGDTRDEIGISLFVADPKSPGIKMSTYQTLDEMRAADIEFRNVRVPASALVGRVDHAYESIADGVDYASALLCAEAVGAMRYACDATLEYLKARKQFGVPIGSFQALQHRMVDMVIEREQCLSMASMAVGAADATREARSKAVGAAALRLQEGCERVSQESIQLHGGMGMTEELKISHVFRRLTALRMPFARECRPRDVG